MAQMGRSGLSAEQKRDLWQRWKAGQSFAEIGRALGKHSSSTHFVVNATGGFLPRARARRASALTLVEREEISRGLAQGGSLRVIARSLGRAPSTISREVGRCGGADHYRAAPADERAWDQARRPQRCLLARNARLRQIVARKLAWCELSAWHFEQPDHEAFPSLQLGYEVARRGGTCGAVLNAANEVAVGRFLAGAMPFLDIPRACRAALDQHDYDPRPTLAELSACDRWARQETSRWINRTHRTVRTS